MPRCPRRFAFAAAAALSTAAATASANGRFPAAGQIAVHPSDPAHLLVRTTFGFVQTRDGGARWDWICEMAVGYGGVEDPFVGIVSDGSLLAGVFHGLNVSRDLGCNWQFVGGALDDRYAVDLSVDRARPDHAIALLSNGLSASTFLTQVFESADDGATWTQAGVDLPGDVVGVTLDAAPSDPSILYLTGRTDMPAYTGVIERSYDRGGSWEELPIPGADGTHSPYLGAVDPLDPALIYVRLDGDPVDSLLASRDGGETWETAFVGEGSLLGFAISPDGARVLVGGPTDGIWGADRDTLEFEKISSVGPKCLTWVEGGLFACGDQFKDSFTVGVSQDEGKTFTSLMLLADVCGPLACPGDSGLTMQCEAEWGPLEEVLAAGQCDAPVGAGGGAGSGGPGGAASDEALNDPGCSCRAAGARHVPAPWASLAALVAAATVARRCLAARR
jgi:photosystem II stability/assembly factor-like uncharacterized protein